MAKRVASGCLVFHSGRCLLLRRSALEDTMQGLWEMPAGKIESDVDGTPRENAIRETAEEAGIELEVISPLGEHLTDGKRFYGFIGVSDTDEVKLSFEHDDYVWLPAPEILVMAANGELQVGHHTIYFLQSILDSAEGFMYEAESKPARVEDSDWITDSMGAEYSLPISDDVAEYSTHRCKHCREGIYYHVQGEDIGNQPVRDSWCGNDGEGPENCSEFQHEPYEGEADGINATYKTSIREEPNLVYFEKAGGTVKLKDATDEMYKRWDRLYLSDGAYVGYQGRRGRGFGLRAEDFAAQDVVLYYGTSDRFLSDIELSGLEDPMLTSDIWVADDYALESADAYGGFGVVLQVSAFDDLLAQSHFDGSLFEYFGEIPPAAIYRLEWDDDTQSWG